MAKVASEFEKMIHADRARKKNEALAAKIFGREQRRSSTPGSGSLTSRAGIQKRSSSTSTATRASNINTEWTHDLHETQTGGKKSRGGGGAAAAAAPGSLASRISRPGETPGATRGNKGKAGAARGGAAQTAVPTGPGAASRGRQQRRAAQVANALIRSDQQQQQKQPPRKNQTQAQAAAAGLSIRGLAAAANEPLVVMAQNFAPGTTAADIESAMTPVGGLVSSCRVLKTSPLVIAEIVFESREGAEQVIATFNNQTADGRVLHVYPKTVGTGAPVANVPTGPRALNNNNNRSRNGNGNSNVVDGSLGFDDPMDMDGLSNTNNNNNRNGGRSNGIGAGPGGKLYSDDLVGSTPAVGGGGGRRGRGRGGRGR